MIIFIILITTEYGLAQTPAPLPEESVESDLIHVEVIERRTQDPTLQGRAHNNITARQIREKRARSTPEALGDEVGAYVQQTAHGQGSVYLRGRTGRHTLLMVDGFRLNHALFRQGPNQYLFTVDPLGLSSIDVVRGGGSVTLGASALAGAILVKSKRPPIDPELDRVRLQPSLYALYASADLSRGARAELNAQLNRVWGIYISSGFVQRGELEASGPLPQASDTPEALRLEKNVPRFREDGRTQRGTGYDAMSADVVSRLKLSKGEWTTAARIYRQYDAPRTDRCPPPEAPIYECLKYDEQFRTHLYTTFTHPHLARFIQHLWGGFSFQRQHERRTNDRKNYLNLGRDAVNVWEVRLRAEAPLLQRENAHWALLYGVDGTHEQVTSSAWTTLVRSEVTRALSRGQYLDGGDYLRGGMWGQLKATGSTLQARFGARLSYAHASAPGDSESESASVRRGWGNLTLGGGISWSPLAALTLFANLEEGFTPPNLDDLTARQLTGQGYQIENPLLEPERSTTYEIGTRSEIHWRWPGGSRAQLKSETWLFLMRLDAGMERRDAECPDSERSCRAARVATPFTLVNLEEAAWIRGIEHQLTLKLPYSLTLREHLAYTSGEGPSPISDELGMTRSLSRIPPFNGGLSLRWESPERIFYAQLGLRWADAQDNLSFGDEIDHRIPYGGTPGYRVYHARLGLRDEGWEVNLTLENLGDHIYRIHGSSVNGAARSASLLLSYSP